MRSTVEFSYRVGVCTQHIHHENISVKSETQLTPNIWYNCDYYQVFFASFMRIKTELLFQVSVAVEISTQIRLCLYVVIETRKGRKRCCSMIK